MFYTARDLRRTWRNLPQNAQGIPNNEKRHILDLEIAAFLANKAHLNEEQARAFKGVLNDANINMHPYLSTDQNLWDKEAVRAVYTSFRDKGGSELPSQQASHIKKQVDVLNHDDLKNSFHEIGADDQLNLMKALYYELTFYAYPEESIRHSGTIVDGRMFYSNIRPNLKVEAANLAVDIREKVVRINNLARQQPGDARVQIREAVKQIHQKRISPALLTGAGASPVLANVVVNNSPLEQFLFEIFDVVE
jgi:hypothetical protein